MQTLESKEAAQNTCARSRISGTGSRIFIDSERKCTLQNGVWETCFSLG